MTKTEIQDFQRHGEKKKDESKKEPFVTADNKSDDYSQDLFKSVAELYGDEQKKRNTLKTVIDPVCLMQGGPQAAIYGKNVQRRIYW
jgi:hypothetical protein